MDLTTDPYVAAFPENVPFWEAAAQGVFLLPRCRQCGKAHWHPRAHCPMCRSADIEWVKASGRASLHTFTVIRLPGAPTILAYAELEEGPRIMTNIVDADPEGLRIGMPLQVAFRATPEGRQAPVFRCA
jgi:uncharacterized OB-fold protein